MSDRWNYRYVSEMLRLYRRAFEHLKADRTHTVTMGWAGRDLNLAGFRAEFLKALDRRINVKGGVEPTGRKTDDDYEWRLRRDAWAIHDHNAKRVAIHSFETAEARERFSHLLSSYDD